MGNNKYWLLIVSANKSSSTVGASHSYKIFPRLVAAREHARSTGAKVFSIEEFNTRQEAQEAIYAMQRLDNQVKVAMKQYRSTRQ